VCDTPHDLLRQLPLQLGPAGRMDVDEQALARLSAPWRGQSTRVFRGSEIEAIEVHDFVPRSNEVMDELLLGVR
jgi:hypothetical protein